MSREPRRIPHIRHKEYITSTLSFGLECSVGVGGIGNCVVLKGLLELTHRAPV